MIIAGRAHKGTGDVKGVADVSLKGDGVDTEQRTIAAAAKSLHTVSAGGDGVVGGDLLISDIAGNSHDTVGKAKVQTRLIAGQIDEADVGFVETAGDLQPVGSHKQADILPAGGDQGVEAVFRKIRIGIVAGISSTGIADDDAVTAVINIVILTAAVGQAMLPKRPIAAPAVQAAVGRLHETDFTGQRQNLLKENRFFIGNI